MKRQERNPRRSLSGPCHAGEQHSLCAWHVPPWSALLAVPNGCGRLSPLVPRHLWRRFSVPSSPARSSAAQLLSLGESGRHRQAEPEVKT
jgi:hypothetical protein